MIDSMVYFYLTLGAAVFYAASAGLGGRRGSGRVRGSRGGRRGGGRGRRRSGYLSLNTAVLFAGGFGIGGFFASTASLGGAATLSVASVTGIAFAAGEALVLGALVRRQGSSSFDVNDYIGVTGSVDISILANGVGRVRCRREKETVRLLARSNGVDCPVNSTVRVIAVAGAMVIVEPADADGPHGGPSWRI
jgi:membrane protein implicated in regulation of membrane protease activity